MKRRLAKVSISAERLAKVIQTLSPGTIPADAEFVSADYNTEHRCLSLVYKHGAFKEIGPREQIERLGLLLEL